MKQLKALFLTLTTLVAVQAWAADANDAQRAKIEKRIAPAATVCASAECAGGAASSAPVAAVARTGEQIFNTACQACHATGLLNAPKKGDTAAWNARYAQGEATVLKHAIEGLNAMPPKGTCGNCSDDELLSAIHFMAGK